MLGMEMLVKSLGIDPAKLQDDIAKASEFAQEQVKALRDQMDRIEGNQLLLYQLMLRAGLIESVEAYNTAKRADDMKVIENEPSKIN